MTPSLQSNFVVVYFHSLEQPAQTYNTRLSNLLHFISLKQPSPDHLVLFDGYPPDEVIIHTHRQNTYMYLYLTLFSSLFCTLFGTLSSLTIHKATPIRLKIYMYPIMFIHQPPVMLIIYSFITSL